MATFVDIADVSYPGEFQGHGILPMEGKSLRSALQDDPSESRTLYFEHEGHYAIRRGDWKLVKIKERDWELYNIDTDRAEMFNIAAEYPELVDELRGDWEEWAKRTNVYTRSN